jgi:polyisoprenoid-binding protein YceI
MIYRSSAVTVIPQNRWRIEGQLTLLAVVRSVVLEVSMGGVAMDTTGKVRVGFHAVGSLTRTDLGLTTDLPSESGGVAVSGDVTIAIDAEAIRPLT